MAGDWIKVEQATLDKAEVLRMAELLGMKRRECLGLLLDFWSWLDNNARAESVPNLSRQSLDDVMHEPGFAAALEVVGWVKWDDKHAVATIVNYEHHNGASAKARAYEQKKKKNQRQNASRECPDNTGTREEKRRDTATTNVVAAARKPRKAVLQEPNSEHQQLADSLGVPCQAEFLKYRDWLAASGRSHKDETAGFRNWLRNAKPLRVVAGREPTLAEKRVANMAAITGAKREREVFAERVGATPLPALSGDLRESGDDDVGGRAEGRALRDVG